MRRPGVMTRAPALVAALVAGALGLAACGERAPSAEPEAKSGSIGKVRFVRELGGAVVPGPVLARDGSVLAATNAGVLRALDPATGKDRWSFDGGGPYGLDLTTSPLQLADGTILWPGPRGRLFAVSAAGKALWSVPLGSMGTTPARGPRGSVYVQDVDGILHAIDVSARVGRERWRLRVGRGVSYASAAVARDGLVVTTVGRDLVAVSDRGRRGRVAWRFAAQADVEVSPAIAADGMIVLGTNDAYQYGISPTGRERWRWKREVWTYSSPVATPDGKVRFGDHRGRLVTLDGASGRVVRVDRGHGQVWGAPAVDPEGTVVFTGHPGEVFAVDARGRRVLHRDLGGLIDGTPALGPDGTVYVGSENGKLFALRPRGR